MRYAITIIYGPTQATTIFFNSLKEAQAMRAKFVRLRHAVSLPFKVEEECREFDVDVTGNSKSK